jgi:23S rRNA pseudouridine2604 synthase
MSDKADSKAGGRKVLGVARRAAVEDGQARTRTPIRPAGNRRRAPAARVATPKARPVPASEPSEAEPVSAAAGAATATREQAAGTAEPIPPTGIRLSKLMAERGLCSRREADELIEQGAVLVDGECVDRLGTRVAPDAVIELARQAQTHQAARVTILLNKPIGYVSGQPEPGYTPAVSLIGPDTQFDAGDGRRFERRQLRGLAPAGRLDIDSTGLLVFTQDGRVARRLIGSESEVEKEYLVRVQGKLDEAGLRLLKHGLELDGRKLRPAKVSWQNEDQLRIVLREGRKRQIRRMCELVGLHVTGLRRVRIGSVMLGKLPLGQWRYLRPDESF